MKVAVVAVIAAVLFGAVTQGQPLLASKELPGPMPANGLPAMGHGMKGDNFPMLPCGPALGPKPHMPNDHEGRGPVPGPKHGDFQPGEFQPGGHKHMHPANGPAPHGHGPRDNPCMKPALPTLPKNLPAKGPMPGPYPGEPGKTGPGMPGQPGNAGMGMPSKPFHGGRKMM